MKWRSLALWALKHWLAGLLGLSCGAFGGLAMIYYVNTQPPVVIDSVETADDEVRPGTTDDTISFVVKVDRQRTCPVQVGRYLWHWVEYGDRKVKDFRAIDNPPIGPMPGAARTSTC